MWTCNVCFSENTPESLYFDTITSTSSFGGVFFFEYPNLFLIWDGHREILQSTSNFILQVVENRGTKWKLYLLKSHLKKKKKRQKFACVSSSSCQKLFHSCSEHLYRLHVYCFLGINKISFGPFWFAEKKWGLVYSFTTKNKLLLTILSPLKRNSFLWGLSAPFFWGRAIVIDLEWKNNSKTVLLSIAVVISLLVCSLYSYVVLRN